MNVINVLLCFIILGHFHYYFIQQLCAYCVNSLILVHLSLQNCKKTSWLNLSYYCCQQWHPAKSVSLLKKKSCLYPSPHVQIVGTCFLRMRCFPFQYLSMPSACNVLTMSFALIAVSWLKSIHKHQQSRHLYYHTAIHLSLHFNGHISRWTWVSRCLMEVVVDDGSDGNNWSYKKCKAPDKSSPPTNQHPTLYRPDALPLPNQQCQSTEGKVSHSMDLLTTSSPGGLPTLSLTTNSSWLPWGGLPCLSSALRCQYPYSAIRLDEGYE